MNKMLGYLKDYKRESVLAPIFKMLEATFDLFVPLVMADIVNIGIAAHDFHYILVRCGILLLLAMIGLACSLTAQYFSAKAAVGYSTALRHALFEHIQTLSFTEMVTTKISAAREFTVKAMTMAPITTNGLRRNRRKNRFRPLCT